MWWAGGCGVRSVDPLEVSLNDVQLLRWLSKAAVSISELHAPFCGFWCNLAKNAEEARERATILAGVRHKLLNFPACLNLAVLSQRVCHTSIRCWKSAVSRDF